MTKRVLVTAALISALFFSALAGLLVVDPVKANGVPLTYLPEIRINSNGTVTPETGLIERTGFTYTLTGNVDGYVIRILDNNIVFDGAGYTINASSGDNTALRLNDVTGVTVKNVEVIGRYVSVYLYCSSNCLLTGVKTDDWVRIFGDSNTITESNLALSMWDGSKNLITRSNITGLFLGSSSNTFVQNNFLFTAVDLGYYQASNFLDNGSVGNYWSDYLVKYPNASEVGSTGIGDTAYVVDAGNVDNYPLVYPLGAPEVALLGMQNATYSGDCFLNFTVSKSTVWVGYSLDGQDNVTVSGNVTLDGLSSGLHNVTVYAEDAFGCVGVSETAIFTVTEPEPEPFPVVVVAAASVVAVISVVLLVYFKKRKH